MLYNNKHFLEILQKAIRNVVLAKINALTELLFLSLGYLNFQDTVYMSLVLFMPNTRGQAHMSIHWNVYICSMYSRLGRTECEVMWGSSLCQNFLNLVLYRLNGCVSRPGTFYIPLQVKTCPGENFCPGRHMCSAKYVQCET